MTMPISGMQKFFNKSVRHLRKQGRQAVSGFSCRYRTPGGQECAIGCNIPNKLYKPDMEGESASSLLTAYPTIKAHFERIYGYDETWNSFLSRLQSAHDGIGKWDRDFERNMRDVAERFNLKFPKP